MLPPSDASMSALMRSPSAAMQPHAVEFLFIPSPRLARVQTPVRLMRSPARHVEVVRDPARDAIEEAFHKNIIGMLNKRGYNVRDASAPPPTGSSPPTSGAVPPSNDNSETSTVSVASNSSTMSSILLGLREPNHGQSPLHLAVRKGDLHVLDALLDNDCADGLINLQDDNGNTALHFAAGSTRRIECELLVAKLLNAGADVSIRNAQGLPPIAVHVLVARVDNPSVLLALLDCGADPNTMVEGGSILHLAAREKLQHMCTVLVSFGASITTLNRDGYMCYEVATPRVQMAMLRGIQVAPPMLPMAQHTRCMRCQAHLRTSRQRVSQSLKRFFGLNTAHTKWNCYHCGLLFCRQCLKAIQVADVLPPEFARSRLDDLGYVKACPLCRAVLKERMEKRVTRQSFSIVSVNNNTSMAMRRGDGPGA